jgi:small-conductance mechanosensitive channel
MRGDLTRLTAAVTAIRVPENTSGPLASATDSVAQEQAEVLSGERVREAAQDAQNFGLRAFWSIIVLVLAWLFIRTVVWLLDTMAERTAARRLFFKKLIPVVRLVIWTAVAYYIITSVFNVDRTGLLAATAALGVGIGFAAQGILRNLFGGLIIIFDQPFQVGDKIRVGGTYGEVVSIGMRATRIVTPDDNLVSVPNAQVVEDQVANANAGALDCQVIVDLYLPGWVDATKAKAIAYAAAASSRYVYLEKPIVVNVKDEFKETFLTHLVVKAYVVDARYEFALASDVTETAKAEFLKEGMLQPLIDVRQLTTAAAAQTGEQEPVEFS